MHRVLNQWKTSGGVLILMLVATISSQGATKPTDVVARVDSFKITVADEQKKMAELPVNRSNKQQGEVRREAINEVINEHLIKLRAGSISLEDDTAFMRQADYLLDQEATREVFNRSVLAAITVSDSEVTERYRQKPENYRQKAWVHASHLLIAPVKDTLLITARQKETGWWAQTEDQARSIADSLYRVVQTGASFDSLAQEWSQDMASGMNGGDLGIFSPGRMVPEFDSVAFHLPIGSVSRPVKTQFGFHLVKVFSRQGQRTAPLSDSLIAVINQQISNDKIIKRSYDFLDSLRQAAGLDYNEKIFNSSDSVLRAEKTWTATSRFGDTIWSDRFGAQLAVARPAAPGGKMDRDYKIGLLKDLINPLLLRRTAQDLKVSESEAYLARKEQIFRNEGLDRVYNEASMVYNPTEEEIREYYQQHKIDFARSESLSVHVQQMVFKTRKEADQVLQELKAGGSFALLARKYFPGDSDVAQEAFDLGFISLPAMSKQFFTVAETLTVGTVSQPVRTEWGFHLIRVIARRPDLSFESARPKIVAAIRKAKQEEHSKKWEATLREGHTISINEQILRRIQYEPASVGTSSQP